MEALSYDLLCKRHTNLFGDEPTPEQKRLYEAFPHVRGYADKALNVERFQAAVALALAQTKQNAKTTDRVLLLAPAAHEKWVIEQFNVLADRIFSHCKSLPWESSKKITLARAYGQMFKHVFIFGKLLQLPEDPKLWTIFGFDKDDPLPAWASARLLAV